MAVNTYRAASYSSGMSGRALGTIRTNHFVIDDPAEPPYDGPGEARQLLVWGRLGRKALLTPKPFHALEVVAAEFDPGGSTGDETYTHGDSEELLVVVKGRVHLQLGADSYDLGTGDSVQYRSSTPHRVSNSGEERAEVLFVISPPSY